MIKLLILLLLSASCAHRKKAKDDHELVTLRTALEQAQMSYLKGCVDAYKRNQLGPAFALCKELAKEHRLDLENFMKKIETTL